MTNQLNSLRKKIDQIDQKILNLLEQRFLISEKIATHKTKSKIQNKDREIEILNNWLNKKTIANDNFIIKIVKLILQESRNIQKKILKK